MSNAIKFSNNEGVVTVYVGYTPESSSASDLLSGSGSGAGSRGAGTRGAGSRLGIEERALALEGREGPPNRSMGRPRGTLLVKVTDKGPGISKVRRHHTVQNDDVRGRC